MRSWQVAYRGLFPDAYLDGLRAEDRMAHYIFGHDRPGSPTTVVAVIDAIICGFVTTGPARDQDAADAGEVYAIYVDPQAWGRGIGRLLIAHARTRLSRQGFKKPSCGFMLVTNEPNALIGLTDGSPTGAGVKNMCGACWPTKYVIAAGCPNADSAGFFAAADVSAHAAVRRERRPWTATDPSSEHRVPLLGGRRRWSVRVAWRVENAPESWAESAVSGVVPSCAKARAVATSPSWGRSEQTTTPPAATPLDAPAPPRRSTGVLPALAGHATRRAELAAARQP